jgi:hypothetical protein
MRTYYRGPDALVTEEQFVWRTGTSRTFAVRELRNVGLARDDVADRRPDVAMVAAAGMVAFTATTWMLVGAVIGMALGFVSLVASTVAVATRKRRTVRLWQVRATYRGVNMTIYSSSDLRVFNQVARALRRALEVNRPSHPTHREAERDLRATAA